MGEIPKGFARLSVILPRGLMFDMRQSARLNDRTLAGEIRHALRLYRHNAYLPRLEQMAAGIDWDDEDDDEGEAE